MTLARPAREPGARSLPLDGVLVPAALLLIARELLLFAPTRELAWQVAHDERVARRSFWLGLLRPLPAAAQDADPVALLLGALAVLLAGAYLLLAWRGAPARARAALLATAAIVLVALPTLALVELGVAMRLPYGHDGGVVQLPLALERTLAGQSPYGADYSKSVLGRQARASEFWAPLGGNPITRHHWYLPGVHLLMIPPYLLLRAAFGFFDARLVTLPGFLLAAWLAARLLPDEQRRLCAAALVLVHPLVYWPQIFGVNDVFCALPLLGALLLGERRRTRAAAALLGLACAVKQLMWPFAPFALLWLAGLRSWRELLSWAGLRRLLAPAGITVGVALAVVAPLALRDVGAFVNDIFRYQVGLPGEDQYPLGGTPGFGFANFVIYLGWVRSLGDPFPFDRFYALLAPFGVLLVHRQLRRPGVAAVLINGSLALLASLYLSRIVNPNYLTLAVICVPLAVLRDRRLSADLAVVPLVLMLLGLEFSGHESMRTTWQASSAGVAGLPAWLAPGDGPRWRDPLSLGLAALAVGLGIAYLAVAWARAGSAADERDAPEAAPATSAPWRARASFVGACALLLVAAPAWLVVRGGEAARVIRAQDRFVADTRGARGLERIDGAPVAPAPVVEAWSRSFRKLGEKQFEPSPQPAPRSALGRALGGLDPRWLTLPALGLAAWLGARRAPPAARVCVLAVLLLSPLAALGAIFGAGEPLALALIVAVATWPAPGAWAGLAVTLFPSTWPAWPLLVRRERRRLAALTCTAACVACWGAVWLTPPGTPLAEPERPIVRAADGAVGLTSVLAYRGLEQSDWVSSWTRLAPWAFAACAVLLLVRRRSAAFGWAPAGLALLAATWLWPGAQPHALLLPFAAIVLAGAGAESTS